MPRFSQQPINGQRSGLRHCNMLPIRNVIGRFGFIVAIITLIAIVGIVIWYNLQLSPVGGDIDQLRQVIVKPGDSSSQIGQELEKRMIVKNGLVFDIYTKLTGKNSILQAGTYRLSPAESVQQIAEHFVKGNVDQFSITFYPGATLSDNTNTTESKKLDAKTVLRRAGYSDGEINEAFAGSYDSPIFDGKPAGVGLEGYIYGETYNFNSGATVADILKKVFGEFYKVINENGLIDGFKAHGLNLYEGITLASIIQREVNGEQDQRQVSQVFYSRMNIGMMLGSDVTYKYIAAKNGLPDNPNIDSPYNTRIHTGLPPGPIASPGLTSLRAAVNPAEGSYLFFLAGDDKKTYFGYTDADHQANIANHCAQNCASQ
ncbi:MAG: endolytic transglycosylase MltG [Candidatus Saccharibacteria bacterium]